MSCLIFLMPLSVTAEQYTIYDKNFRPVYFVKCDDNKKNKLRRCDVYDTKWNLKYHYYIDRNGVILDEGFIRRGQIK